MGLCCKNKFCIHTAKYFLILSIIFLVRVFIGVVMVSNGSGLEDFVISMFKNKKELLYLILTVSSLLVGVYG